MGLQKSESKTYLSILGSDGQIHQTVEEGVEGAVKREYETSDGKTGEKWELKFSSFTGFIIDVKFFEGDFGANILIDLKDEDDNEYTLAISASSTFGEQFMMKLPNLDLTKEVLLKPYSFPDKKNAGKRIRGLKLVQDDEPVLDYFTEYDEVKKTFKTLHGMPSPDKKKTTTSEKWKLYFAIRREWLMDYLIENELVKAAEEGAEEEDDEEPEDVEEGSTPTPKKKGKKSDDDF